MRSHRAAHLLALALDQRAHKSVRIQQAGVSADIKPGVGATMVPTLSEVLSDKGRLVF